VFVKSPERRLMMELQDTLTTSISPGEYAPWMATTTTRGEHVFSEKSPQFTGLSLSVTPAYMITANLLTNSTIASQFMPLQGITIDAEDTLGWEASFNSWRDITIGSISQMTVIPMLSEFRLFSLGMQLAKRLANTLDQIRVYNRLAIYPIVSILEPYIEEAEELVLDISPISSIRRIARVIDSGRVEPKDTDVQGESFFHFLDELESGAYAADDTANEE
jgi:hypothetical protein